MNYSRRSDGETYSLDPFRELPVSWGGEGHSGIGNLFRETLGRSQLPCTLFIGDLPLLCNEEQLFSLFSPFGKIESVQLKRNGVPLYDRSNLVQNLMNQPQILLYGFIKFVAHEDAARAMQGLNGALISGRRIRVGWARDSAVGEPYQQTLIQPESRYTSVSAPNNSSNKKTAQIHVLYVTPVMHVTLVEADLFQVFRPFGKVIDVTIKKSVLNQERQLQSGYGFVHFEMTDEGIQSALRAVEEVNQRTIGNVTYEVTVSHGLKTHLLYLSSKQSTKPLFPDRRTAAPFSESWNTDVESASQPRPYDLYPRDPFVSERKGVAKGESSVFSFLNTSKYPAAMTASSIISGSSPSSASEGMRRSSTSSNTSSISPVSSAVNGSAVLPCTFDSYVTTPSSNPSFTASFTSIPSFQHYLPSRGDF